MKTYSQVVRRIASEMIGKYLGGYNDTRANGIGVVAFIYGKKDHLVDMDVNKEFKRQLDKHYKSL